MFNFSFLETFATDLVKIRCSQDFYGQKEILPKDKLRPYPTPI